MYCYCTQMIELRASEIKCVNGGNGDKSPTITAKHTHTHTHLHHITLGLLNITRQSEGGNFDPSIESMAIMKNSHRINDN